MQDKLPMTPGPVPTQEEERAARRRLARIERVKQELSDKPRKMERADQRTLMATNLWRIIQDARQIEPTLTEAKILHEAQYGQKEDSTKYSEYYILNPNWPNEKKERRAKKLLKTPRNYQRISEAAATLAHKDKDWYLLDLVAGTSFGAEAESDLPAHDPQREAWSGLKACIETHARRMSADAELQHYFARQQGWGLRFRDGVFLPGARGAEEPSTFLGWVEAAPRSGLFRFRELDPRESFGDECTKKDIETRETLVRRNAYELRVDVRTVLVLHLVLAPTGAARTVVPNLRARCITYIIAAEYSDRLEALVDKPIVRGDVIARCNRGLSPVRCSEGAPLPDSIVPKLSGRKTAARQEFDISEAELSYRAAESAWGFDMGSVELSDAILGLPLSLASEEEDDSPHFAMALNEEALAILGLPISSFMMERWWAEWPRRALSGAVPPPLLAVTVPLAEAWVQDDATGRSAIDEIGQNPTPFNVGTMLAALDRACQAAEHPYAPPRLLAHSAEELSTALRRTIMELEKRRDANLKKSF